MTISPWRTGVALGALMGGWHLAWSALVALGWAQAVVDFILWIHFIEISAHIAPFKWELAAILVALTFGLEPR